VKPEHVKQGHQKSDPEKIVVVKSEMKRFEMNNGSMKNADAKGPLLNNISNYFMRASDVFNKQL